MIRTHNLSKKFGDLPAVEQLNLEVGEGEVFGFLGPNGAGKTTTIRMLTCLIAPTSGSAIVNGYACGKDDQKIRQSVGILTETPGIYDGLSAAYNLEIYNRKRQTMEKDILNEILAEIERTINPENVKSLVFASYKWHPGVIGIVASKLVDRYYRPTILISLKDGIGKGSGRSIADFNIYNGLKECDSLLLSYGGHRYAAGISIKEGNIKEFSRMLEEVICKEVNISDFVSQTKIDAMCNLNDISFNLISEIGKLAPFGSGNPEPVFCVRNINVSSQSVVGNNHLRMRVSGDGVSYGSIWFNKGHLINFLSEPALDIVFTPHINLWNGACDIQLKMKDIAVPSNT